VNLSWNKPYASDFAAAPTSYVIYRAEGKKGVHYLSLSWNLLTTINDPNTLSYTDNSLTPSTTYYFKIASRANGLEGSDSDPAVIYTPNINPDIPSNLSATTRGSSQIDISWTGVPNAAYYVLCRWEVGSPENCFSVNGTTYSDVGLKANTLYYYTVGSFKLSDGPSRDSAEVSARTYAIATPVVYGPSNLTATFGSKITPTGTIPVVTLKWEWDTIPSMYGNVYRSEDGYTYYWLNSVFSGPGYYEDLSMVPGKTYWYKVNGSARYNENVTPFSNSVSIITYSAAPPVAYGPTNLTAAYGRIKTPTTTVSGVILKWDPTLDSYGHVYRSEDGYNYTWHGVVLTGPGYYEDGWIGPGKTYWYKVTGAQDNKRKNETPFSNAVMVSTATNTSYTLSSPTNFSARPVGYYQIHLQWNKVPGAKYYTFKRFSPYGMVEQDIHNSDATSYEDVGLVSSTIYSYKLYSRDEEGRLSAMPAEASARTYAFAPPAPRGVAPGASAGPVGVMPVLTESNVSSMVEFLATPAEVVKPGTVNIIKYNYFNSTEKTQYIRLTRELVNSNGRVVARTSAIRNVGVDKDFTITARQAVSRYLPEGTYTVRVRITDRITGNVLDENSFDFTVSKTATTPAVRSSDSWMPPRGGGAY
jgi:hypothetical protein